MSRTRKIRSEAGKVVRFGLVGLTATLIHLAVAQIALLAGMPPEMANANGFVVAFLAGLVGHYRFTFPGTGSFGRAFWRYGVIALAGFAVNNVVLFGLEASGWVSAQVSLTVAVLIVPVGTFFLSRLWGFTSPGTKDRGVGETWVSRIKRLARDT